MDIENLENDSAKSPQPERITGMDSGDPRASRDVGPKLEPERSEFDDPGFRSAWVMPVGLGVFLAVAALVMSLT
jgi:hypothetical protein